MKTLLLSLVLVLSTESLLAQQQDSASETRLVRELLRDWIRVQIKTARLQAEQQRMTALLQERATAAAELTRLRSEIFSDSDLANLEQTNPSMAASQRETRERLASPVAEAESRVADLERQIGATQKRIDALLSDLGEIEARLDAAAKAP